MAQNAVETKTDRLFVHLKTSLKHDDAQICVAYNVIWAGLSAGMAVDVLVDADAVNTFKKGRFSDKDDIQDFKLPENMRQTLAKQFALPLERIPVTYGAYLKLLQQEGANFYINAEMLITAEISSDPEKDLGQITDYAAKIFKPISLIDMLYLKKRATLEYTY